MTYERRVEDWGKAWIDTCNPPPREPDFVKDMRVKRVIFSDPATIVIFRDGAKEVVKCTKNDTYNPTTGLALCIMKRIYGKKKYRKILKEWLPEEEK